MFRDVEIAFRGRDEILRVPPVTADMSKGACGISHARGDTEHKISLVIFHVKCHMCIYIATIPLHSNL